MPSPPFLFHSLLSVSSSITPSYYSRYCSSINHCLFSVFTSGFLRSSF
jgi:hypothetical protein